MSIAIEGVAAINAENLERDDDQIVSVFARAFFFHRVARKFLSVVIYRLATILLNCILINASFCRVAFFYFFWFAPFIKRVHYQLLIIISWRRSNVNNYSPSPILLKRAVCGHRDVALVHGLLNLNRPVCWPVDGCRMVLLTFGPEKPSSRLIITRALVSPARTVHIIEWARWKTRAILILRSCVNTLSSVLLYQYKQKRASRKTIRNALRHSLFDFYQTDLYQLTSKLFRFPWNKRVYLDGSRLNDDKYEYFSSFFKIINIWKNKKREDLKNTLQSRRKNFFLTNCITK